MKTGISYKELEKLIHDKAGKNVRLQYEDSKTVKVSYDIDMFFTTKTVDIYLEVCEVNYFSLKLRYYSYGFAVEKIISIILNRMDSKVYSKGEDNTILIFLSGIKGLDAALNTIHLANIRFSGSGADILLQLQ